MKRRTTLTVLGIRSACGPLKPGTRFEMTGSVANDGEAVFLRYIDANTIEVLPLPLALGNGLLLAAFWWGYQVARLWRCVRGRA